MSVPDAPPPAPRRRPAWPSAALGTVAAALVLGLVALSLWPAADRAARAADEPLAPEFPEKLDWMNTAGPLKMADLKGKVVIYDFWTLCCINCIHILPDLAKLEKKYPNELVVVGVHSPKFDNEKETKSIRKAVLRYEIAHPVVNDADRKIWDAYGVESWPTMIVFNTEGRPVKAFSGEGNLEALDAIVAKLVAEGKKNKTLNETPIRFDLIRFREAADTPLFFPGKVLADEKGKRLFIADSTHHRVVVTDLDGKKLAIIGDGSPGYKDGKFADARFDDPQGMALDGDTLYVADRKNHSIRAADLKAGTVSTVAGTGKQDSRTRFADTAMDATKTGLNSPWDLLLNDGTLFIAMAGHHQIWTYDLKEKKVMPYAGDGVETIRDGPLYAARFAQPSGLSTDGKYLYVADSEVSAVRRLPMDNQGRVNTLIGSGLFDFGDKDGPATVAKIQHALAVQYHDGKLILADTYNSKLKYVDPKTGAVTTWLATDPKTKEPLFNEPAGLSVAGGKLYVADTNAHRIRVVDLKTSAVSTLKLTGVEPPPPQKEWLPPKK